MTTADQQHAAGTFLKRGDIRELKRAARMGDGDAALRLLDHSVLCGHTRLALLRFFVALELNAGGAMRHAQYFRRVCKHLRPQQVSEIRKNAESHFPSEKTSAESGSHPF